MKKEDINEFVGYELHELAWRNYYPLQSGVAIWCWINGLQESGFRVNATSDPLEVVFLPEYNGVIHELTAIIRREEILMGWGHNRRASPSCLNDAIYEIFDRLHYPLTGEPLKRKRLPTSLADAIELKRRLTGPRTRKVMERHLLPYFVKNQEGILVPMNGNEKELPAKPEIIDKLISQDVINLERIDEALTRIRFFEDGPSDSDSPFWLRFTNSASTVAFLRFGEIPNEDIFPTESRVYDYIWGAYLLELIKQKDYPLRCPIEEYIDEETEYGALEVVCEHGWGLLKELRK